MTRAPKRRGATRKPTPKQRKPIVLPWLLWLRYTLVSSVLCVAVTGVYWIQKEDTLPILHVTVDGDFEHVDKKKLVEAVKPFVTGSFINIDVASLRKAGEATPWVKQIQVKRSWPDTIHLVVEEQHAIAQWEKSALVNESGELFYPNKATFPAGLVELEGPKELSDVMVKRYMDIAKRLKSVGLAMNKLELDERRSWTLKLAQNITVKLGRADSETRLERFLAVYTTQLAQFESEIKVIDMRYTNGLAINWKSGHQPEFNGTV